ncbi:MAG: DsrE family protein [Actinomycetes bacterium]
MQAVFQINDGDPERQLGVLRNLGNARADLGPDARLALVAFGPGITLTTGASGLAEEVSGLLDAGVEVLACANSMRAAGLADDALLAGVSVVSSGVGEIVRLQHDGWSYVRP